MATLPTSPSSANSGSCISISVNSGGTPKFIDSNSSPTTFVQADCSSFKKLVQLLTAGTSSEASPPTNAPWPPPPPPSKVPGGTGHKRKFFKLYERRESLKNLKMTLHGATVSPLPPRKQPSPSSLDFPGLSLSPITPLVADPFCPRWISDAARTSAEQECAIAEKGFHLHPSPREAKPPKLLPLFPLTSPRMSSA